MAIRKFRKGMKPFIFVVTIVFLLSLAYGGYQELRGTLVNKKAQEAFKLNKKVINKLEIERAKNEIQNSYSKYTKIQIDKSLIDVLATNQVIDKNLTLDLAKNLKIKVPSSEVQKHYENVENSIGDKEQFKRMLEIQGFSKDSYKAKIEEELLIQKVIEEFSKNEEPSEDEIREFYALNILKNVNLDAVRDKIIEELKKEKGLKKYQESLDELRKVAKYENISSEYKELLEKTVYEEEGFAITNFDLTRETLNQMIKLGVSKEEAENLSKTNITKKIKIAKIAKEKGIEVNNNLNTLNQLELYYEKLLKKYKEDLKVDEDNLKVFFNKNSSNYDIKASADVNLAIVNINYSKEDEEEAKTKAEEILKEVTIENFEKKGMELSKKNNYIFQDLGTFSKGMMVKEFEEAVKNTKSNRITKNVVRTSYGYHIVFVKESDNKANKWTASHILVPFVVSEKTIQEKMKKLEKIQDDINSGLVSFAEVQKLDEDIIQNSEIKGVDPDGLIPGLVYNKDIASAIFGAELNKAILLKETQIGIILFQKISEIKARKVNFEEVKKDVEIDYRNYKVNEYISTLRI